MVTGVVRLTILHGEGYSSLTTVMSNADHSIKSDIADKLKTGKFYAQYAGWNFCGYVFWDKNQWACEIWVYHNHEKTIKAETLSEIMDIVSEEYGSK